MSSLTAELLLQKIRELVRVGDVDEVKKLSLKLQPILHTVSCSVCFIDAIDTQTVRMVDVPLSMLLHEDWVLILPDHQTIRQLTKTPRHSYVKYQKTQMYGTMCIWDENGYDNSTESPGFKMNESVIPGNAILFDVVEHANCSVCIPREYQEVENEMVFVTCEEVRKDFNALSFYSTRASDERPTAPMPTAAVMTPTSV